MPKSWAVNAALSACLALGLCACSGGGGGSNVKSNPPPTSGGTSPPPTPLDVKGGQTVTVASGMSAASVRLYAGVLDNAGTVGGSATDVAVTTASCYNADVCPPGVYPAVQNRDGGRIEGKTAAIQLWSGNPVVANSGTGSIIRSPGNAIEVIDSDSQITNTGGATISAGKVAIVMGDGGTVRNGAGSLIETTGTATGNCLNGGACSIYVPPKGYGGAYHNVVLQNAGTIIGNVQLDPTVMNAVTLQAGGTIRGNLLIDEDADYSYSSLSLDGEADTTQRYSQAVIGTTSYHGTVVKQGEGTWIVDNDALLLGSNLYDGATGIQIDAGTLQIGLGGTEGPEALGAVEASANGRLRIDRGDDYVFDTSMEGGVLEHAGTGLLTLRLPYNTVRTTVQIDDGRRVEVSYFPGLSPDCCWDKDFGSSFVNNGTLTFDHDYNISLGGGIYGTGSLTQNGPSRLAILGVSTYTGGTTINGGALQATAGLPGDVLVREGGTLGGGYAFGSEFLRVNGLPSVGGDVSSAGRVVVEYGNTSVGGDYSQSATGTLAVRLGSKLDVAGVATLDGGTLEITNVEDGYVANAHTEVLTAGGGVVGAFDRLVKGPRAVFTSTVINYDANSVWLDTTGLNVTLAAQGDGIGYTPASSSAADRVQGAFEQINERTAKGDIAGVPGDFLRAAGQFQRAPSIAAAQASLRSLSGQLHAASAAMTFREIDAGNQALSERLDGVRAGSAVVGMWTQQLDGNGSMARSGFDGVGYRMSGWLVGNDYRIGRNGVAGFAFGQGMGIQQLQHGADRDDSHRTEGMVYAGLTGDRWYAQGRVGFGHIRQLVDRQLLLGNTVDGVWTHYDGRYQAAYGESGLRFGFGGLRIAPFASVEYARSDRDAFAEEGAGGFGLRSDAQSLARWQASLGLRATRRWDFGHGRALDFGAHAQWRRTLGMSGDDMDASFVGLQQWSTLAGIGLSRYGSLFGVGMNAQLSSRAALKLSYDYERGQYDRAQGFSAGVNIAF